MTAAYDVHATSSSQFLDLDPFENVCLVVDRLIDVLNCHLFHSSPHRVRSAGILQDRSSAQTQVVHNWVCNIRERISAMQHKHWAEQQLHDCVVIQRDLEASLRKCASVATMVAAFRAQGLHDQADREQSTIEAWVTHEDVQAAAVSAAACEHRVMDAAHRLSNSLVYTPMYGLPVVPVDKLSRIYETNSRSNAAAYEISEAVAAASRALTEYLLSIQPLPAQPQDLSPTKCESSPISVKAKVDALPGGSTPVHRAVYSRDTDLLRMLLADGARFDSINAVGDTPLHIAARVADAKCAAMLLHANANVALQNLAGQTPLELAEQLAEQCDGELRQRHFEVVLLLKRFYRTDPRECVVM
eukprot:TRINITY_DN3569_c0_g1_i1.p1 TRINITY_DN3569_c0_g1~~TRINITY_DN3569_c0_g1_i1.p1  ORF type:complete len:358 (-),score=59.17 TRINITY_DN3569_c0_g1_i1:312-1385(-)